MLVLIKPVFIQFFFVSNKPENVEEKKQDSESPSRFWGEVGRIKTYSSDVNRNKRAGNFAGNFFAYVRLFKNGILNFGSIRDGKRVRFGLLREMVQVGGRDS